MELNKCLFKFLKMKKIGLVILLGFILGLQSCQQHTKKEGRSDLDDQYVGPLTEQDLQSSDSTKVWFTPAYSEYEPDKKALETIKENINDYHIIVFMGTWCPDSHREIPKFYKLLDAADFNMDHLKVYALDEYKSSKENYEEGYDIDNIPTIIFYKNDKEINRFVEQSQESIEKDIAKIVSGQDYKNYYQE